MTYADVHVFPQNQKKEATQHIDLYGIDNSVNLEAERHDCNFHNRLRSSKS